MTAKTQIPTAEKSVDFHIVQGGVEYIGRAQIAQDYDLHPTKVHRLLNDSTIVPVGFVNRFFYPEPAVRKHLESLGFKQVSQAKKSTK